ncbi:MAG: translation initiation factor IF-2, partial [Erysipelotrichaceae bacterium]|nr:translation initiation factor IF-2 [Erysipelotrichaceae bacterium]
MTNKNDVNRKVTLKESRKNETRLENSVLYYSKQLTVSELSAILKIPVSKILTFLFMNKKILNLNSTLDDDTLMLICLNFNIDLKKEVAKDALGAFDLEKDQPKDLLPRPPVVTVMGHVDHGKTSLIDAIRKSRLTSKEVGGISQKIGAYQISYKDSLLTIIDTPGHEAFTAMRGRGAAVTDIVVLVVAADDGVMPQTVEAISHAKAANAKIIVAINKIDKPGKDLDKIKQQLMKYEIIPEEYGGENIFVEISAKQGMNIDLLLESIVLLSDTMELKANPNRYANGVILEAVLDKGEGAKATFLVQNGTLKTNDYLVAGSVFGKVRRMTDENGRVVFEAKPSTPVSVIGLSDVPQAGDQFISLSNEKQARDIANQRQQEKNRLEMNKNSISTFDDLINPKEGLENLNLIIKADSSGSAEALKGAISSIKHDKVKINFIHVGTGNVTNSDLILAATSKSVIYAYYLRPDSVIRAKAKEMKVEVRVEDIVYRITEEIESIVKGLRPKEYIQNITGVAEVRKLFKIKGLNIPVAGSHVLEGVIKRDQKVNVIRDGVVIQKNKRIASLKHLTEDIKEARV